MILYTLAIIYLTGAILLSSMCVYTVNEQGKKVNPSLKDRLIAGATWPLFFYQIVKGQS